MIIKPKLPQKTLKSTKDLPEKLPKALGFLALIWDLNSTTKSQTNHFQDLLEIKTSANLPTRAHLSQRYFARF